MEHLNQTDTDAAIDRLIMAGAKTEREQYLSIARQAAREDGQFVWGEVVYLPGVTPGQAYTAARAGDGSEAALVDWRFTPAHCREVVGRRS